MKTMALNFEWFANGLTAEERDKLAWHLAMFRAKQTYEALRYAPKSDASPTADPTNATAGVLSSSKSRRSHKTK
jgi:hypothetical protein